VTDPTRRPRRTAATIAVAVLGLVALVAAGCGTDSDDEAEPAAPIGAAGTDITVAPDGEPRSGGRFVYALEAESDGYNPATNRFAPAGTIIGLSVFDPLGAFDEDMNVQPYLAESMTANEDYTEWTITAREGIQFHNGEPLDGAAMAQFYEALRADALVGIAFTNIESVAVSPDDPLAVVLTMEQPWASFPVYTTGQGGMMAAPAMLDSPDGSRNPVGTGPFRFREWIPDNRFVVERNPDYWRTDENGNQLPYLDTIEFRPIPEQTSRDSAIESGDVSMMHLTNPINIDKFRQQAEAGRVQILYDRSETEESFIMLNTAAEPFDDIRARQALAYATDRELVNDIIYEGHREIADSVFRESSPWRGEPEWPDVDFERARQLVDEYEADHGPLQFELAVGGPDTRTVVLLQEQWAQVGIDATVESIEQSQFIVNAAVGDYQAYEWRQFGAIDPDYDYLWWHSSNANPPGELALNFARNSNPEIDAALDEARGSADRDARLDAYQRVEQLINDDFPYIWLSRSEWALVAQNNVRGITNGPLPDGSPAFPMGGPGGFGGVTFLTQTWLAP
jgi:peptide/nickel transport system substrate-binding protein